MKKYWLLCICIVLLLLPGCREKVTVVQNEDDGRLRLDEQHTIDFYLGNEEAGADPITEQCIGIIGRREPDAMEDQEWPPGSVAYAYHINGAAIRILQYGEAPAKKMVLLDIGLGGNHVLQSGIHIGSTEAELKQSYEDKPDFYFHGYDVDDGLRAYVLYGPWYEKYLILFEVDPETGRITGIDYELDI